MSESLRYDQLSDALVRLGYTQDAAEYHGALCGALCVKPPEEIDPLRLLESSGAPSDHGADAGQALSDLRGQSAEALSSTEMAFNPLLPDDHAELPVRVRALSAWCEGFLYGLSTRPGLNLKRASSEMLEIIRDFTEFTRAVTYEEDDADIEETAYAELVEYIRVGVQLVYLELRQRAEKRKARLH